MKDYKELISNLRCCFSGECGGCTLHEDEQRCQERLLEKAADAIEHLANERDAAVKFYVFGERNRPKLEEMCKEREELAAKVARLEAENRAKEQYIAETIGKVIKERDTAIADIRENWICASCMNRVLGREWCRCKSVSFAELADGSVTCENYEWRGVQEVEHEAD